MTTYSVDRCANQSCRTTIDLDWSAVSCPCGAVVTCDGCDEVEACDTCRAAREHGEGADDEPVALTPAQQMLRAIFSNDHERDDDEVTA